MKKNFIKILIGSTLIAFGLIFILSNTGVIPMQVNDLIRNFWPVAIIPAGIYWIVVTWMSHLTRKDKFRRIYWASAMILFSLVLIENKFQFFFKQPISLWEIALAVLLVFIGMHILFFSTGSSGRFHVHKENNCEADPDHTSQDRSDQREKRHQHTQSGVHIGQDHFVGEIRLGKTPWALEDSSYRVSVGDIEVDLSTAFLSEGATTLELNSWVGDIEIKIPEDMAINLSANVNIGSIDLFGKETKFVKGRGANTQNTRNTSNTIHYRSDHYDEANKKVNIEASVNIGEISIERV